MFSGIVEELGRISRIERAENGQLLAVDSTFAKAPGDEAKAGDSWAVNGVCLTVLSRENSELKFHVGSETLRRTTLGTLAAGSKVNLERSLKLSDRLHGHQVLGHIDWVSEVTAKSNEGESIRFEFSLASSLVGLVVEKGSVAIDGVSLTVGAVTRSSFSVYVFPYTLGQTTFGALSKGSKVNIEVDCLARYVQGILSKLNYTDGDI